ncbi:MAG: camphor resistance protein CrcB, partial [Caproiciproducens sp.]|nr:camphor resistance protein CrcB [Caproiciproducens sp.]
VAIHQITLPLNFAYRPLFTMFINISGSFLLGLALTFFARHMKSISPQIRLGIATGVLGGYTTFSTLCKESVELYLSNHIIYSMAYAVFSVALGLAAAWLGMRAAKRMERRRFV